MKKFLSTLGVLSTLVLSFRGLEIPSPGATLMGGEVSADVGQTGVIVPISLTSHSGASVAALNFDLSFDPGQVDVQAVTAGEAAVSAEKEVVHSSPSGNLLRVIVYGLNQNAIGDGVVVEITVDIRSDAQPGLASLIFEDAAAASPDASLVPLDLYDALITIESPTTFMDVPKDHWAYAYIEALYQAGYVAGCSLDPPMYCPEKIMDRAESAVFVVRGVHGAGFAPPQPTEQVFGDVPLWEWFADWTAQLWVDSYTSGCGTDPLIYCPFQEHTRAEGAVFFLRMMNGADYLPPDPVGIFADVTVDAWYARWVEAAYAAGILPACEERPELKSCPMDPLDRAMGAYMMVLAKEIRD
ncbi:MAG: hypothetical protein GTO18_21875 [Anaerolineales bacterium]|nr:hypothetical protein [Anaerolineales bacterium]